MENVTKYFRSRFLEDLQYGTSDTFFCSQFAEQGEDIFYGKLLEFSDSVTGFSTITIMPEMMEMMLTDYEKLSDDFRHFAESNIEDWAEHPEPRLYLFSMLA